VTTAGASGAGEGGAGRSAADTTGGGADRPRQPTAFDDFAERVLDVVDRIPPGRVLSYGDIAELLGDGGPRRVGRVLGRDGSAVPWWRVLRADGTHVDSIRERALALLRAEGAAVRGTGPSARVDMDRGRWDISGGTEKTAADEPTRSAGGWQRDDDAAVSCELIPAGSGRAGPPGSGEPPSAPALNECEAQKPSN
jgi:alkylated DNA nucleotide flippase Atl1